MHFDWLTVVETFERAVEGAESFLRRHARAIWIVVVVSGVYVGLALWPVVSMRVAQSRPQLEPAVPRPRASRNPSPRVGRHPAPRPSPRQSASPRVTPTVMWVHVAGAVSRPGVVRLRVGARAFQAVEAAGGLMQDADMARINLARRIDDEAMIVVPRQGETPAPAPKEEPDTPAASGGEEAGLKRPHGVKASVNELEAHPVRVNTATADDLRTLPGIGAVMAQAIVEYRTKHGPFARIEDLRHVPRFSEHLWKRVGRFLTL